MTSNKVYDEFWNTFKGIDAYIFVHKSNGIRGKYIIKNTDSTSKIYLHIFGAVMRSVKITGHGFNRAIEGTEKLLTEMRLNPIDDEKKFIELLTENLKEVDEWRQYRLDSLLIEKDFIVIQAI